MLRYLALLSVALLAFPGVSSAAGGSATVKYYTNDIQDWGSSLCHAQTPESITASWGVACPLEGVSGRLVASVKDTSSLGQSLRVNVYDAAGKVCATGGGSGRASVDIAIPEGCGAKATFELGATSTIGTLSISWG